MEYELLAKDAAGNWKEFESFAWHNEPEDGDKWTIVNTHDRDSGLLEQSNADAIEKELSKFGDDVLSMRSSHWAVGWVEGFAIRVYDAAGEITQAFKTLCDLNAALEDYPCLDDEDFSRREYEATCDNIHEVAFRYVDDEIVRKTIAEDDTWEGKVFGWLWANDQEQVCAQDDQGGYPSDESCIKALKALGLYDVSRDEDE